MNALHEFLRKLTRNALAGLLALSLALPPGTAIANPEDLPEIGSPSDAVLSKQQETQIGRAIYRSLRSSGAIIIDPEIQEYIQSVGQRLGVHAQDGDQRFRFFVINDPVINAFALPGGYIGIHSGLMLATETESELAGVLAHEISHVTQRHISRAIYANQRVSIFTMAAMLGAILLGAAAGAGGDAIAGAVSAGQSIAAQEQINFTRSNEYEADRVGVGVMVDAGFDPQGMPDFFETMARNSSTLSNQVPEFLLTHPVTTNRIAETRNRAEQYPVVETVDTNGYSLAKARLRLVTTSRPEAAMSYFENELENPKEVGKLGPEYGIALAYLELGKARKSAQKFEELLSSNEGVIQFHTGKAMAQLRMGDTEAAMTTFSNAMELFPRNVPLTLRYSEALLEQGNAELAHEVLLDLLNQVPPTSEQVRLIALAASAAGDSADAHYYMAEYHIINGDLPLAADQLRLALSIPGLESVQRARFTARLKEVQQYMPRPQNSSRSAGKQAE
ncbi:MAG: M48 family metalloprotease [Gammaproteobacteria bacterium]